MYSLISSQGGWNKWGGDAKVPELINKRGGLNKLGDCYFLEKKLVHECNKWGVEGGKNLRNQ